VPDLTAVCSRLGSPDETVRELTLEELADGHFEPLSVVILIGPGALPLVGWSAARAAGAGGPSGRVLAWGRSDAAYEHRGGMITKAETRAVILAKLALPERGVLWDVGSGSGSVAVECALLSPGLTVFAIERDPASTERITANAARAGVGVHVIVGEAPEAFETLPVPDRIFVGGGGSTVLSAALSRLAAGGHAVASFAAMDRALEAARVLGHLVQVRTDRAEAMSDGGWRLVATNPVFVAWGPSDDPAAAAS
jgi:precorrin-6Y C5,15-methyltransferase (decarboxylating)